jgi:hypothetical protein
MEDLDGMWALTLWRPWAWAIALPASLGGKRIENRTWHPPARVLGQRIAIHAGKTWDAEGAEWIAHRFGLRVPAAPQHPVGIIATARVVRAVERSDDPWFIGPVGWVLDDVRPLARVVSCTGHQGLWRVPNHTVVGHADRESLQREIFAEHFGYSDASRIERAARQPGAFPSCIGEQRKR